VYLGLYSFARDPALKWNFRAIEQRSEEALNLFKQALSAEWFWTRDLRALNFS
jgi:hypothetical protein